MKSVPRPTWNSKYFVFCFANLANRYGLNQEPCAKGVRTNITKIAYYYVSSLPLWWAGRRDRISFSMRIFYLYLGTWMLSDQTCLYQQSFLEKLNRVSVWDEKERSIIVGQQLDPLDRPTLVKRAPKELLLHTSNPRIVGYIVGQTISPFVSTMLPNGSHLRLWGASRFMLSATDRKCHSRGYRLWKRERALAGRWVAYIY